MKLESTRNTLGLLLNNMVSTIFYVLTILSISILLSTALGAQQKSRAELLKQKRLEKAQKLKAYQPKKLEKFLLLVENNPFEEILKNGYKGFHPVIGGLKSGSGAGGGIRFEPTQNPDRVHFSLQALASIRFYQDYKAALGYENNFLSIFSYAQYRNSPQDDFYGIGPETSKDNRTNFRLKDKKFGGVFSFRPLSTIRTSLQCTYLKNEIGAGTSKEFPSIEENFRDSLVPGLENDADFYIGSASLLFDFRDVEYPKKSALKIALLDDPLDLRGANPFKGTYIYLKASRYEHKSSNIFDFNRYEFEFQQYFPFIKGHRVIAFRNFISLVDKKDNAEVPFYLMQAIGGSMSGRGYQEFRFRDRNALLFNIEYRWYAWSGLDMALFYDAGKVFPRAKDINLDGMKTSYGIGFHFNSKTSLPLRIDIANSKDGIRFNIKFNNIF